MGAGAGAQLGLVLLPPLQLQFIFPSLFLTLDFFPRFLSFSLTKEEMRSRRRTQEVEMPLHATLFTIYYADDIFLSFLTFFLLYFLRNNSRFGAGKAKTLSPFRHP